MEQILLISSLQTLSLAACALVLVWLLLRAMDKSGNHKFTSVTETLRQDPMAAAVYYGARFIGACLLVGLVI